MILRTHPTTVHGTLVSRALPEAQLAGGSDVAVNCVTDKFMAVQPGDAFVACEDAGDIHAAAKAAVARGAVAVISDRFLPVFGVAQYVVDDARAAYSQLCHAILDCPSRELNAVAIAGTHGKTSVAMVLDSILNVAGRSAASATNQFTRIDGQRARFVLPTTAPAVAEFLDEALASGCRQAVVELSEDSLRTKVAQAAEFDVVCLTNLHSHRADANLSPQSSRDTVASALEMLTPTGMAIFNADDQDSMRVLSEFDGPALTFGLHSPADITASIVEKYTNEQVVLLTIGDESAAVRTKVIGETHVANCLAAAAIAKVYGVSLREIAQGIERVTVVPGVMHRFDAGLGVSVFLDRGNTPIARGAALTTARGVATEKVIAVVDHSCSVTEALADKTVATHGLANEHVVTDAVAKVLAALQVSDTKQLRTITEKLTGIALAILSANEGDVVVVSGLDSSTARQRRASVSISEAQMIQSLMYELAAQQKKAA
ncbi:Mur ligase family protein [Aeoliella sp. ICT_H6.2]|uniref:Mur ligase family protein n=1 Tax=Aeoliella straminimaris TaxID=2954799 RepID=A0A9X2JG08_9BACT|nr:Mur ligase family protein [Aeoliella straminimaris]MCO6044231.1 Mur ligase family protein [Aeoliella straminimaris]